jgi:hypothetical protein
MAASVDTLDGFIREMKIRFASVHTGSLPAIVGGKRVEASR